MRIDIQTSHTRIIRLLPPAALLAFFVSGQASALPCSDVPDCYSICEQTEGDYALRDPNYLCFQSNCYVGPSHGDACTLNVKGSIVTPTDSCKYCM